MRLGVLSDIHSNWPALKAVHDDLPSIDRLVCAGDIVGYNPWPSTCVRWVRANSDVTIAGNHDRAATAETPFNFTGSARAGIEYTTKQLQPDEVEWLRSLPTEQRLTDGDVLVVHGHPSDPDRYVYPHQFTSQLLERAEASILIMGHTHKQAMERVDGGVILNPGSVGQPRDRDPRAAYAVVDTETLAVELHRVPYDIETVAAEIQAVGLPASLADRLSAGR